MAVGTVSSVGGEEWQLISTQTPSTTSVTLTSFSGYKTIMVVGKGVTKSTTEYPKILVNGNTTAGNYATLWGSGANVGFLCQGATASASGFIFRIYDCDKAIPHKVDTAYDGAGNHAQATDAYVDPVTVTSLVLTTNGGTATFTGGTVYVYGIAV